MPFDYVSDFFGKKSEDPYSQLVEEAARRHGVDAGLIRAMMAQESAGNAKAVSPVGAQGLMQLMPDTAAELGVKDVFDPAQNIEGGTRYMAQLLKRYGGDRDKALMAYNAGMGAVDAGRAQTFPETQNYLKRINAKLAKGAPATPAPVESAVSQMQRQYPGADVHAQGTPETEAYLDSLQARAGAPSKAPVAKPPVKDYVADFYSAAPPSTQTVPAARTWTDTAVDALPTIGGIVGGTLGLVGGAVTGPGAIASTAGGGAVGAGMGEFARQSINKMRGKTPNQTLGGAAAEAGKTAALDGAMGLAGGVVGKAVLKPAAKLLTKVAFRPSAEALQVSPHIVDDILEQNIALSRKGAGKARSLTSEASQIAEQAIRNYDQAGGGRIPLGEILQSTVRHPGGAGRTATDIAMESVGSTDKMLRQVGDVWNDAYRYHPSSVTATNAQALKKEAQRKAADAFYGGAEDATFAKTIQADVATGAKHALETRVSGLKGMNAETQRRLMVQKTVEDALFKGAADVHNPMDKVLLARGLATGNPVDLALAAVQEAGKFRRGVAAVGRGAHKLDKRAVPANLMRANTGIEHEQEASVANKKARRGVNKKRVDTLYARHQEKS